MKKKAALFISAILVFCIAACGAENVPTAAPGDALGEGSTEDLTGEGTDTAGSNILIAYFSVPEDVDTIEVDVVAGASVVVKDGEKLGNTEYAVPPDCRSICQLPEAVPGSPHPVP